MSDEEGKLSVGQEFALCWMLKRYHGHRDQVEPGPLFQEIASAVDSYVEGKQVELSERLRKAALEALEGGSDPRIEMGISLREMFESERLARVARTRFRRKMDAITRFPVS
ncbi:MAG: hypothetical protein OXI26_11795 [bacterium]|nr:hypothetical protein [bacterium]